MRTKHSMRKRLKSLAIHLLTQAKHLSYPCPPHHHPMMKKQSRHTHVDQVLIMIVSVVVVYEQDVGSKSSNRGHGFSKRFNPAGVYQLPIIGVAYSPISLS